MIDEGYTFNLTEELARWAFELRIEDLPDWQIAFSNPTAGPWKRVCASDAKGITGEVHRFGKSDLRPDLLLVNDALSAIVIVEAKPDLPALVQAKQVAKSCRVVNDLAVTLSGLGHNSHWNGRAEYQTVVGLLWGATVPAPKNVRSEAFGLYEKCLSRSNTTHAGLIAIEVLRTNDDLEVTAMTNDDATPSPFLRKVQSSF